MRRHLSFLFILLAIVLLWLWFQPSPAGRHFNRGLEAKQRGDWAEAESQFTAALADEPFARKGEAYSMRARAREHLGRVTEAMEDHHQAVALAPADAGVRTARGTCRSMLGDTAGAMEDFNAALTNDPNCVEARYNRGAMLWALGRRQEAEVDFGEAQRLRPELSQRVAELKAKKE